MTIQKYEEILEKVKDIPTTRVVVELHKVIYEIPDWELMEWGYCNSCYDPYPCITMQVIEKELK